MKEYVKQLEERIVALERALNNLSDYSNRTPEQDNALVGRGFPHFTGKTGSWTHTTYGGAGSYDVPSQPSGTLTFVVNNKEYQIPFL